MVSEPAKIVSVSTPWAVIRALVGADGTATHPLSAVLRRPLIPARDVADVVHAWCLLHGRLPGVIDHALAHDHHPAALAWLETATTGFATERAFLAKLASAGGPLPSTPGHAESENTIAAQRHAVNMLAQSDRAGCAIGAAIALVMDWAAVRLILDAAATRFGVDSPACTLPGDAATAAMVSAIDRTPAIERAISFAVQQMLAQHRGLWDLLDARASAREPL
ncbi:MAG: DUF6975 family protein [Sphingomonas sp.]